MSPRPSFRDLGSRGRLRSEDSRLLLSIHPDFLHALCRAIAPWSPSGDVRIRLGLLWKKLRVLFPGFPSVPLTAVGVLGGMLRESRIAFSEKPLSDTTHDRVSEREA